MNTAILTELCIQKAKELGFDDIGFAKATLLEKEAKNLEKWLAQGLHGEMSYMENHFDKRVDPRILVPGAKTVISLSYNYFNENKSNNDDSYHIAMYAWGNDYHDVVKEKLDSLVIYLKSIVGDFIVRSFTDSAPVMERAWAERSGVGWIGKNTLCLTKSKGSYYFLSEIICDLEFVYSSPVKNYCGSCTRCIDACPTGALQNAWEMDANKCISYITIENKTDSIPSSFAGKMNNWIYGCDICQQVCPINARAIPHQEKKFDAPKPLLQFSKKDWNQLEEETFRLLFKNSAVKRAKYKGFMRNIRFIQTNNS